MNPTHPIHCKLVGKSQYLHKYLPRSKVKEYLSCPFDTCHLSAMTLDDSEFLDVAPTTNFFCCSRDIIPKSSKCEVLELFLTAVNLFRYNGRLLRPEQFPRYTFAPGRPPPKSKRVIELESVGSRNSYTQRTRELRYYVYMEGEQKPEDRGLTRVRGETLQKDGKTWHEMQVRRQLCWGYLRIEFS